MSAKKTASADVKLAGGRVPADLWRKAKVRALDEGITMRELLEKALREYVETKRPSR